MGDGRYYTYQQFFQILYLTMLSGGLVYTIVYIQIKSREKERIRYIVVSSSFLLFTIVLSFIKEVTYGLYPAEILTYLSMFGIIGAMVTQIIYYNKRAVHTLIVSSLALVLTRFHFIDEFAFTKTTYSNGYQLLIAFYTLVILVYILVDIRKRDTNMKQSVKRNGLKRYEWLESLTIGGGILITVTSYCFFVLIDYTFPVYEIYLFICIFGFNLTFQNFMPHERIPAGYHSLIENMMDTIIIVNKKKKILFINNTKLSHIIKKNVAIDFENIDILFNLENTSMIRISPEVEQINGYYNGELVSSKISYKSIEKKGKHVGFVIVIEDCSHLEVMIEELRAKKKNLTDLEKELSMYNRTSQALKAEKEQNRLLIEVQNELGHHLAELSKYIGNTIDFAEHEALESAENYEELIARIVQGISMARRNLSKIRETVKTYRSSYNGREKRDDKSIISR